MTAYHATTNYLAYAFVQYFDVVGSEVILIDSVDKKLGYIWLAWVCGDFDWKCIPGKYFGLCPIDSLRGTVHTVEVSQELHRLKENL